MFCVVVRINKQEFFLNNINLLVFIMQSVSVCYEVRTDFLFNLIFIKCMLQRFKSMQNSVIIEKSAPLIHRLKNKTDVKI